MTLRVNGSILVEMPFSEPAFVLRVELSRSGILIFAPNISSYGYRHISIRDAQETSSGIWSNCFLLGVRPCWLCWNKFHCENISFLEIQLERQLIGLVIRGISVLLFSTVSYCRHNLDLSESGSSWPKWRASSFSWLIELFWRSNKSASIFRLGC